MSSWRGATDCYRGCYRRKCHGQSVVTGATGATTLLTFSSGSKHHSSHVHVQRGAVAVAPVAPSQGRRTLPRAPSAPRPCTLRPTAATKRPTTTYE